MMLGLNEANSIYACAWCKISNKQRSVYSYRSWVDLTPIATEGGGATEHLIFGGAWANVLAMLQSKKNKKDVIIVP